jgi:hypothetical protein
MVGEDPTANNKSGDEAASSLAARRARLRGTLAKQATPPDPYVPDPSLNSKSDPSTTPNTADPQPAKNDPPQGERRRLNTTSITGEMPAQPSNGTNGGGTAASEPMPGSANQSGAPTWEPPEPDKQGYSHLPLVQNESSSSPFVTPAKAEPVSPFSSPIGEASHSPFRHLAESSSSTSPFVSYPDADNVALSPFSSPAPEPDTASTPFLSGETETPPSPFRKLHEGTNQTASTESEPTQAGNFLETLAKKTFPLDPERTMALPRLGSTPPPSAAPTPPPPVVPEENPITAMPTQPPQTNPPAASPATHPDPTPATTTDESAMPSPKQPAATSKNDPSPATATAPDAVASTDQSPQENASSNMPRTSGQDEDKQPPMTTPPIPVPVPGMDPQMQAQAIEVLNNIDQGMGACAMNLSALQKIAGEQTESLKVLAETMQNQNFFEIGLNLNTLMESFSAALEPMKSVGELVPAIDQLVTALESKEHHDQQETGRLSPELLVTSLADQLSNGTIDPWTFKAAYMAVYPSEHPADLLHRLVDLLGTKRLSGDLFRAAYDAVQAADSDGATAEPRTVIKVVQDETLIAQLEELKKSHDELRKTNDELRKHNEELTRNTEDLTRNAEELKRRNDELGARAGEPTVDSTKLEEMNRTIDELQKRLNQRETEFADVMAAKDQELQEAQELLNSRWEEFNARYDELTETLHKRDELIAEKEAELGRKESEVQQLKTQMEELRDSTKDMVAEMQKQLTAAASKPKEEKQSSFFDPAPAGGAQPQPQPQPSGTLFDAGPSRPLFQPSAPQQQPMDQSQSQSQQIPAPAQPAPVPVQVQVQPQTQTATMPAPAQPAPQAPPQPNNQAIPRPAPTTAPFLTSGSYGSGVRAQVFEVIVRQALAGAPWREICAGPMSVNNITPDEVETEVKRRQALLGKK